MRIWKGDTLSGHNFFCQGATPLGNWKIHSMSRSGNFMKAMVDFQCPLIYQKVKRAVVIPKRMHQKPNRCLSQSSVMGARTKFRITTQKPDVRIILNPYEMKCTEGTHGFCCRMQSKQKPTDHTSAANKRRMQHVCTQFHEGIIRTTPQKK